MSHSISKSFSNNWEILFRVSGMIKFCNYLQAAQMVADPQRIEGDSCGGGSKNCLGTKKPVSVGANGSYQFFWPKLFCFGQFGRVRFFELFCGVVRFAQWPVLGKIYQDRRRNENRRISSGYHPY